MSDSGVSDIQRVFLGCLLVRFSRIGQVEREISIVVVRFARIGHVGHETCGVVVRFARIGQPGGAVWALDV